MAGDVARQPEAGSRVRAHSLGHGPGAWVGTARRRVVFARGSAKSIGQVVVLTASPSSLAVGSSWGARSAASARAIRASVDIGPAAFAITRRSSAHQGGRGPTQNAELHGKQRLGPGPPHYELPLASYGPSSPAAGSGDRARSCSHDIGCSKGGRRSSRVGGAARAAGALRLLLLSAGAEVSARTVAFTRRR
jgi:hypothetical protein